jgi:choline dehydrogenase
VGDQKHVHGVTRAYMAAAIEQGVPKQFDLCASQDGTGLFQCFSDSGARMTAAAAYIRPASRRDNLGLRVGVHVTRILFDDRCRVGWLFVCLKKKKKFPDHTLIFEFPNFELPAYPPQCIHIH